jgi:hypothetical protein
MDRILDQANGRRELALPLGDTTLWSKFMYSCASKNLTILPEIDLLAGRSNSYMPSTAFTLDVFISYCRSGRETKNGSCDI